MVWTNSDRATLRQLWLEENSADIGKILGKTRNAVIGQAHRMNLPKKDAAGGRRKVASPKPKTPRAKRAAAPAAPHAKIYLVPLMQATSLQCRAIIDGVVDENGLAVVCGKPIVQNQTFSFCSEHLKRFTTSGGYRNVRGYGVDKQLQGDKGEA